MMRQSILTSLNPGLIERDLTKHIERQFVSSLADMPRVRQFYGRDEELDQIATLLTGIINIGDCPRNRWNRQNSPCSKGDRTVHSQEESAVPQMPGVGWIAPFWRLSGSGRASLGQTGLSDYLQGAQTPNPSICSNLIIEGLNRTPSLIVVDDVHKISDEALASILSLCF